MPRTRTRVDDEEALIPRSDLEEFHMRTKKKMKGRCAPRCCSVKCWFAMLLLMILMSTAVFYFIYPSVVHENLNKIMDMACTASGYSSKPNATVTCLVMTSANALTTKGDAINKTWGSRCFNIFFFYEGQKITGLTNAFPVDNITSLQPLSMALKANATSWYLQTTDDVYISHNKLQRHLSTIKSSHPVYLGDKINAGDSGKTFVLSYDGVMLLMNKTRSANADNMLTAVSTYLNTTESDAPSRYTMENPLNMTMSTDIKLSSSSKAFAFRHVAPDQMYSIHVFNSD